VGAQKYSFPPGARHTSFATALRAINPGSRKLFMEFLPPITWIDLLQGSAST